MMFIHAMIIWLGKKKIVSNFSLSGFDNDNDLSFTVAWENSFKSDRYNVNV
jgi:hypothetical protein